MAGACPFKKTSTAARRTGARRAVAPSTTPGRNGRWRALIPTPYRTHYCRSPFARGTLTFRYSDPLSLGRAARLIQGVARAPASAPCVESQPLRLGPCQESTRPAAAPRPRTRLDEPNRWSTRRRFYGIRSMDGVSRWSHPVHQSLGMQRLALTGSVPRAGPFIPDTLVVRPVSRARKHLEAELRRATGARASLEGLGLRQPRPAPLTKPIVHERTRRRLDACVPGSDALGWRRRGRHAAVASCYRRAPQVP